jgi:hypothetical protein
VSSDALAQQFRASQVSLSQRVLRSLIPLWGLLDGGRLDVTFSGWALAVGQVIGQHRDTSTLLATGYLRAARHQAGIPGEPIIVKAGPVDPVQLATSLRVTGPVAVKRSMLAGKPLPAALDDAFVQSSGAATRHVLAAGRDTVTQSIQADAAIAGYERVTAPGTTCKFCVMLATRGPVYKSSQTAGQGIDRYHDHCRCAIAAVYRQPDHHIPGSGTGPDPTREST